MTTISGVSLFNKPLCQEGRSPALKRRCLATEHQKELGGESCKGSMYQVLATAVLLAATVFPLRLEGQMRATQHPSGPARISVGSPFRSVQPHSNGFGISRGGRFFHRPGFVGPVGFRHHRFHLSLSFGGACFNDPFVDPFFCRQFLFRNRFFFAQSVFLPYPVYVSSPYYQIAEQNPATTADQEAGLASEVDRLREEIERLRDEERSREEARQPAAQPRPSAEEKTATTILVFRDGRRSEIQNYAIVGQTLWVLTERRARKVAMSDLDVEATRKLNADRGVEFRTP